MTPVGTSHGSLYRNGRFSPPFQNRIQAGAGVSEKYFMNDNPISSGDLSKVDPGPGFPDAVRMIVEIGKNSTNKYEYDVALGVFRLDRVLYSPMHYPGDYGFIPGTIAEDGDPIDVLCLVEEPSFPGCMLEVRPLGMLDMVDNAAVDRKILAVPVRNPRYAQIRDIGEVQPHILTEIEHFFEIYKELEGKTVSMKGWRDLKTAREAIIASRERFLAAQRSTSEQRQTDT